MTSRTEASVSDSSAPEKIFIYSGPMLMNRVEREACVAAESFDAITGHAVEHLEQMYFRSAVLLHKVHQAPLEEPYKTVGVVLTNALKSLTAAFALLRTGWRLQPYSCLRNGIEATSVVIHLVANPGDLRKFKDGKLDVPKTLRAAKMAIPPIGRLYGMLTEEFVHLGKPFWHLQRGNTYTNAEWEMWQCLASVSFFSFIVFIVCELAFYRQLSEHHCWLLQGDGNLKQTWSPEIRKWRSEFVTIYGEHFPGKIATGDFAAG
jgi:hypothetical protein